MISPTGDSDSDGMPDAWESSTQCMTVGTDDAARDIDFDGLRNII